MKTRYLFNKKLIYCTEKFAFYYDLIFLSKVKLIQLIFFSTKYSLIYISSNLNLIRAQNPLRKKPKLRLKNLPNPANQMENLATNRLPQPQLLLRRYGPTKLNARQLRLNFKKDLHRY